MSKRPKSSVKRLCRTPKILSDDGATVADGTAPECSFCGRGIGEVRFLVGSGTAKICEHCIVTCSDLIVPPRRPD